MGGDGAVLKLVRDFRGGDSRWPSQPHVSDPYYWRREPLVYESGLLGRLRGGLRAPACRGVFERAEGLIALWLEEIPEAPPWTPEQLGSVAYRFGRTQAAFARDLPAEDWLSRDWLRMYLALHEAPDPEAEAVLDRLERMQQTLCHHDPHPGNLLGPDGSVAIDWAYCGLGALGLDAGVLVSDSVADSAIAPELGDAATDEVWSGYLAGLRDEGWCGEEDEVRYAFLRGTALRLSWLPRGERPAWDAAAALLDRWREAARELA